MMLGISYNVSRVKCPSVSTDRNQIYTNCGACAECDMFTVSVTSLEYKARCYEEGTFYYQYTALLY
jgi:hypothetical protein